MSVKLLDNARNKIEQYNEYDLQERQGRYNSAYRNVLKARRGKPCLVGEDGSIDDGSLEAIGSGLIAFGLGEQIDETFPERLRSALGCSKIKGLDKFMHSRIDGDISRLETDVKNLFEVLSARGGLSRNPENHFWVGATKTMNFLFPDLFVIVDENVSYCCFKAYYTPDFDIYWKVMMICHRELNEWKQQNKDEDFRSLLGLDDLQPTTLTRVFDKCAFVMGRRKESIA